jgi:hypothetical protein
MKKKIEPLSLEGIRTYSLQSRKSLVRAEDFARPAEAGASFRNFLSSLPNFLAAKDLREIVGRIASAHRRGKPVLLGMGAHPLKVGLSPLIIHLMERGVFQGVALNGAGIIHDFEIAYAGRTSEDVAAEIGSGSFGMAEETGRELNEAIRRGWKQGRGLGQAVGAAIEENRLPCRHLSVTAAGVRLGIPITVHVAVGTDIIHLHPQACGEAIGETSHRDFRLFAALVSRLKGGVDLTLGSAVILPEVFLKALTLARNLGHPARDFTTVNMDFIAHYRPLTNVVRRPTLEDGKGFHLTGHHEIMFPLLTAAVLEEIESGISKRIKGKRG